MTLFNYNITDTWQVAFQHGQSAFRLLKLAQDIESEYLENIQKIKKVKFGDPQYLKTASKNKLLSDEIFKHLSASIMLFQGMMEAIINNSLELEIKLNKINKNDSFGNKWINALVELGQKTDSFEFYISNIYKKYRNKLVHPRKIELNHFNNLDSKVVLAGFAHGWIAYEKLYLGLGYPHFENSWKIMLDIYNIHI